MLSCIALFGCRGKQTQEERASTIDRLRSTAAENQRRADDIADRGDRRPVEKAAFEAAARRDSESAEKLAAQPAEQSKGWSWSPGGPQFVGNLFLDTLYKGLTGKEPVSSDGAARTSYDVGDPFRE